MKTDKNKKELTTQEKEVLHDGGTERPFTGEYWDHSVLGKYACKTCGQILFESDTKLDSSRGPLGLQGWPAFDTAISESIIYRDDNSIGMHRTEVLCSKCGVHLGHLFNDTDTKTGKHFCINSCTLDFIEK